MVQNRTKRILYGVLFPVFILIGCLCASGNGLSLPCMFRELTGLYCPGCGSGRSVAAILRGDWGEAFRYNPMLFLLGFPSMGVLIHEYIRVVFAVPGMKPLVPPQWLLRSAVAVLTVFWILRNIPQFSFLAPGG